MILASLKYMNLLTQFTKAQAQNGFDWQLSQEVNVTDESGQVIAKAEIELITLNKHRDAIASYNMLDAQEATDWEIPLNIYFKGHNLSKEYCDLLQVTADAKKAKTHILIEAFSVVPAYRKKGVAKYLLQEIAKQYEKVQSINVISMPLNLFLDPEYCESEDNSAYYQSLDLSSETIERAELVAFFTKVGFLQVKLDESELTEPLPFDVFVASPKTVLPEII
jgi:GNAT superfamily N-acetyltransferase